MAESKSDSNEIPKKFKQWTIAQYAKGTPKDEDLKLVEVDAQELKPGEILVKTEYLSVDPYMRSFLSPNAYGQKVNIGDVMTGGACGRVIASKNKKFKEGSIVQGQFGWRDYVIHNGFNVRIIPSDWKPSLSLGVLGMPGATAYLGFLEICNPRPGETVFVTGSAGAVGSIVGQLAKIAGCNVIGSVGTQTKADHCVKNYGFDGCVVYKNKSMLEIKAEIEKLAPNGIDCFFDNTGGPESDAAFLCFNQGARVSVCGQISLYNVPEEERASKTKIPILLMALAKQAKIQGFMVNNWDQATQHKAHQRMFSLIKQGKLKVDEDLTEGFENARKAFFGLFSGENLGKKIVKL